MSNRRKLGLAPRKITAPVAGYDWLPQKRPPWNRGLTLTAAPSVSTIGRRLRQMEAAGLAEHVVERTGKPGGMPHLWSTTPKAARLMEIGDVLFAFRGDTSVLRPGQVDLLISLGYAARRDDGTVAFLEDYQAWWKYWNSKREAAEDRAS